MLEAESIPLEANGQSSWFIDAAFPDTDTSGFVGSVRCDAVGTGMFTAVALELDAASRIFTTLPVSPVRRTGGRATELNFAHFANGDGLTSDLVFVNLSTQRSRPARQGRGCSPEWPWSWMPSTASSPPCRSCRFQRGCLGNRPPNASDQGRVSSFKPLRSTADEGCTKEGKGTKGTAPHWTIPNVRDGSGRCRCRVDRTVGYRCEIMVLRDYGRRGVRKPAEQQRDSLVGRPKLAVGTLRPAKELPSGAQLWKAGGAQGAGRTSRSEIPVERVDEICQKCSVLP